jgi:tripartite-type tricarboxylate transporter receptor subunit TctC
MKKILLPLVLAMSCTFASSQQISSTPIKVIMPQASASGLGLVFRLLDAHAQQNNITLVPVFKPGGSGKIGLDYAASSADENALLLSTTSDLVDHGKLDEFRTVTAVTAAKLMLVASNQSGIRHVRDMVKTELREPGKLKWVYMTSAQLTMIHAIAEHNNLDKSKMTLIQFGPNSPGLMASIANGDADLTFTLPTVANPLIQDKRMSGVDLDTDTSNKLANKTNAVGLYLTKNSKQDVNAWTKLIDNFLTDPRTKVAFESGGMNALPTGPENLEAITRNWIKK